MVDLAVHRASKGGTGGTCSTPCGPKNTLSEVPLGPRTIPDHFPMDFGEVDFRPPEPVFPILRLAILAVFGPILRLVLPLSRKIHPTKFHEFFFLLSSNEYLSAFFFVLRFGHFCGLQTPCNTSWSKNGQKVQKTPIFATT